MSSLVPEADVASVLKRFDRQSPDSLIRSLAEEFVRVHRAMARLEARIAMMETLSAMSDQILASADAPFDYPKSIEIDATSSSVELVGVHPLEHAADGLPFRWSGPERHFSVQIFVSRRQSASFDLHFGRFYADIPAEQLRAFVDGEEIALTVSGHRGNYRAQGALPQREEVGGTVLTFIVPAVESPADGGSEDSRLLGLLFIALKVSCSTQTAERAQAGIAEKVEA